MCLGMTFFGFILSGTFLVSWVYRFMSFANVGPPLNPSRAASEKMKWEPGLSHLPAGNAPPPQCQGRPATPGSWTFTPTQAATKPPSRLTWCQRKPMGSWNLHHSAAVTGSPTTPPPPHHSISVGTLQALLSVVSPFSSPWTDDTRVRSFVISLRFWNILPYSLFSLLFRLSNS